MLNQYSAIPDDIMQYDYKSFFNFVKHFSGEKVADLLEYQDLSNAECLLACDDPLEILSLDSDNLLDLKMKTCIKLNNNSFAILPGIKSKMNLLKNALLKKCNQLKKEGQKISSTIIVTNASSTTTSTTTNSVCSSDGPSSKSKNISLSSSNSLTTEEKIKQHLIQLINDWCSRIIQDNSLNQKNFQLMEGIDYEIIIDIISTKVVIRCQCSVVSTLGQKDKNYILSNYIRHLTNSNRCHLIQSKLKDISKQSIINIDSTDNNTDTSIDMTNDPETNSSPSTQALVEKRKYKKVNSSSSTKKKKN